MGARCASLEDGVSPCQLAPCKPCCSTCPSSSSTAAVTPTSRNSSQRTRTPTSAGSNEEIRSAFSPPDAAEDAPSAFSPSAPILEQEATSPTLVEQESVTKAKASKGEPKKKASRSDQVSPKGESPKRRSSGVELQETEADDSLRDRRKELRRQSWAIEDEDSMQIDEADLQKRRISGASMPDSEVGDDDSGCGSRSPTEDPFQLRSSMSKGSGLAVKELKTFRQFLKPRFKTPGEAYDDLLGFSTVLDEKTFMTRMKDLEYIGNSERLFTALASDGSGVITREAFKEHLVAIARIPQPKKKSISFGAVILHAVQSLKAPDLEEDTWDPTPLDEETAQMPPIEILIDEAEESKDSKPKASYKDTTQFVEITNAQPSASGQPHSGSSGTYTGEESAKQHESEFQSEGAKAKGKNPTGKAALIAKAPVTPEVPSPTKKKKSPSGGGGGMLSPGRKGFRRKSMEKVESDKSLKVGGEVEEQNMVARNRRPSYDGGIDDGEDYEVTTFGPEMS